MKIRTLLYLSILVFLVNFTCANANVIQYFLGTSYTNPADINNIDNGELIVGTTGINTYSKFTGQSTGGVGTTSSNEFDALPYVLAATRINPQWAIGINISQPYFADIQYGDNSILKYDSTQVVVRDVDINPMVSFKPNNKLSLGAGIIANYMYLDLDNVFVSGTGYVVNSATSLYYGWDLGVDYTIDPKDFISLAFFSQLRNPQYGYSAGGTSYNGNLKETGLNLPATTILSYTRFLTDKWTLNLKPMYSRWSATYNVVYYNMVGLGTLALPVHYHDTWAMEANTGYKIDQHWEALGGLAFDEGATTTYSRTVAYPNDNAWAAALGANYKLNKQAALQFVYAYAFFNTHLSNPLNISAAVGHVGLHANVFDIRFIYNI